MNKKISIAARALAIGVVATLVLAGTAMGEVSRTGLVGEWHFDGDAKDSSGNENHGTIYGASFVDGISGKALSFNGVSDYVYVGDPAGGILDFGAKDSFTIEAWGKTNTFRNNEYFVIKRQAGGAGYYLGFNAKDLIFNLYDGSVDGGFHDVYATYTIANAPLSTGTWFQLAGVRDVANDKMRLYINGKEYASVTDTTVKTLASSTGLYIGRHPDGTINAGYNDYFNGIIDEVRIYNRALSTDEIKANYEAYITPSSPKPPSPNPPPAPSLSNSGGGSWQSSKEITVKENSGSTLTDYQVLVQLSGSNFPTNARSDGADIRFTDASGNELSYWIESWDYSGKNTKIWVKVPSIPAGASATMRMYYSNPSASSVTNGEKTFIFFDDFERYYDNVDINGQGGWITKRVGGSGYTKIVSYDSRKHLELHSTQEFTTVAHSASYPNQVMLEAYAKPIIVDRFDNSFTDGTTTGIGEPQNGYVGGFRSHLGGNSILRWINGGYTLLSTIPNDLGSGNIYYRYGFSWVGNELKVYRDNVLKVSATDSTYPSRNYIHLSTAYSGKWAIDWVLIRKYTSLEPTISLTAEQIVIKVPSIALTKSLLPSTINEDSTTTITIKVENTGTDAKSIKITDTIPQGFTLISGTASQEYAALKAGESRTFQYIIKSAGTGKYVTDAATATYSDDKGNSYTSASNTVAISVLAKGAPIPTAEASKQEDKSIPYLLMGLGGGVIIVVFALLLRSRSKPQTSSPQAPAGVQTFDAERQRQHQILPPEKLDSDTRSYLGLGINTALSNLGAKLTKAESDIRIAKDELKKTEDVLSKLEARLANKEITEQTYKNLETKYKTKVTELQNKVAILESEAAKLKKIYSFIQEKGKYYT